MLASMTAFQRQMDSGTWGSATLEIKTVNHRYLEMNIRLPEELRQLEPMFRETIQQHLSRGKVDCTLKLDIDNSAPDSLNLNVELAGKLIDTARSLDIDKAQAINPLDILHWPGVINKKALDIDSITRPIAELLTQALGQLLVIRRREGEKLGKTILARCNGIAAEVEQTRERLPAIIAALRARYQQKAHELLEQLDNDRLEQEILHMVQKMDVAEELDRLEIHLDEVRRVLDLDEPVGRRLDFLMQEMNREANTLASKSIHTDTSNSSIELKVLIEQIREQIQNIE